jgi:uncharacterized ferritin-like protein (DUF455 family)
LALIHAICHIELNAIDLALDIVARFSRRPMPNSFFDDWMKVASEEAKHFSLCANVFGKQELIMASFRLTTGFGKRHRQQDTI